MQGKRFVVAAREGEELRLRSPKGAYQTVGREKRFGRYATSSSHAPTTSSRSAGKKFGPIRLMWMMDRYRI